MAPRLDHKGLAPPWVPPPGEASGCLAKAREQPCSEAHMVKAEPLESGLRPAMHPDLPAGPELSQEELTLQLPRPPGDAVPGGALTAAS